MDAEVIVVGAGPGGASAAFHLARLGRRVLLLDRQKFPRDKSCGDWLTRSAVRLLDEMGVVAPLRHAQKIRGVRIFMRGKGSRDFSYQEPLDEPHCDMVAPRMDQDQALCQQAVAQGAALWEEASVSGLIYDDSLVVGVEVTHQDELKQLYAPVVIAADGAASRLAYQANLADTPPDRLGYAIRGYYTGIEGLTDLREMYMPLLDATDRYLLPSYGWVFPMGPSSANIGVSLILREHGECVRDLFARFLTTLRQGDPRFKHAQLKGMWKEAPLRFDFVPERCAAPGLLLVGDAAGLIRPFTGEGISYALESGKLAAETIDRSLRFGTKGVPDLSAYTSRLAQKYYGYFETGRQSVRRYLLVWHALESTFQNDKPLFALCRQTVLFPEGTGTSYVSALLGEDVSPLIARQKYPLKTDLLAVSEVLLDTVRHDWPFLAQLFSAEQTSPRISFRPSLFLLLAGRVAEPKRTAMTLCGAAVELGHLAQEALSSVEEEDVSAPEEGQRANWGNMFSLMVGDFLLSKAYALSTQVGTGVSQEIAAALARACEGRVRELRNAYNPHLTEAEYIDLLSYKMAASFELSCRLGALLCGASAPYVNALTSYGRHLGIARQLADDVFDLSGQTRPLGKGANPREGIYSLPILRGLHRGGTQGKKVRTLLKQVRLEKANLEEVVHLLQEMGTLEEAMAIAHEQAQHAQHALEVLPKGPVRASLARLAQYSVTQNVSDVQDLYPASS